ncbi:ead/Ea22-like family protein [Klebsiella pneumoniae]
MTDITELAQSLKAAAEKATPGRIGDRIDGSGSIKYECHGYDGSLVLRTDHKNMEYGFIGDNYLADEEFFRACVPDAILALVEALEKAQQRIDELLPSSGNMLMPALEGLSRDHLLVTTQTAVDNYSALHTKWLEDRQRIAELESRTVMLPPELYTIGELIRTQDNRITDQPMFVVFQKREIIGSDEHSPSRVCWVWDGEEVSELRAKRLEALYQDGRDTRGYDRYAMQEVDEFVTACFTEHGCKDYLRQNGHNLRLPYIYACGSFRNNEYQLVRNLLAGIKVETE